MKARQEMAKRRQDSKSALLSPAAEDSPKAESPSIKRTASGLSASLSSDAAFSPATSRANLAMRSSASTSKLSSSATSAMTAEQMTKSFEEWMKMAADNKINSKNSWSFALIDYFSELTFLRDGDSINFQKASCTLDGCVKIYASRVDSVVDETTKLLNGLTDKKFADDSTANDGNDAEEEEEFAVKAKSRKPSRLVETIEKNPEALCLKNFDLEFSIDPLFKKTSAEFDEGNNRGTLLKSLEVSPLDNLVIFDSSDKIPIDFGVFDDDLAAGEPEIIIDISQLQQNFGSALVDLTAGKSLCPAFEDYSFTASADMSELMDRLSLVTAHIPQNDFVALPADNDDDNYYEEAHFDDGMDDYYEMPGDSAEAIQESPQQAQKHVHWSKETVTDETGLSYFDATMKQTWAGPEHWKIRRSARVAQAASSTQRSSDESSQSAPSSTQSSRRASKQEKPAINFAAAEVDLRSIFAKPPSSASITLGKAAILERNESKHLLPDDLHFTSANLLKLFIKPDWKLNLRANSDDSSNRRSSRLRQSYSGVNGNFVDRDFWLSQDHERKEGVYEAYNQAVQAEREDEDDAAAGGFDDFDDYDGFPATFAAEPSNAFSTQTDSQQQQQFSQQMVAAPRFTFAPQLNYARVAKRVDIAKLKATLWQEFLESTNAVKQKSPVKKTIASSNNENSADTSNTFSHLISNLAKTYPTDALAEVSVPYCFICLLHLANENNLEIKPVESDLIILN